MTPRELVQTRDVTLDGLPAVIAGARLPYARVIQLKTGLSVEYAWPTVERIVTLKDGRFHS